jgi:hypothetical protein
MFIIQKELHITDAKKYLNEVKADTLIIHAIDDETASPKNHQASVHKLMSRT